eukprot:1140070-Pelagomonas_calceolata.AAC.4
MSDITKHNRQPHQPNANRHVHLNKIKYCEDMRPGQQLEAAHRQHADLTKLIVQKLWFFTTFSWALVGLVILSIPLTSFNNWDLTINVPWELLGGVLCLRSFSFLLFYFPRTAARGRHITLQVYIPEVVEPVDEVEKALQEKVGGVTGFLVGIDAVVTDTTCYWRKVNSKLRACKGNRRTASIRNAYKAEFAQVLPSQYSSHSLVTRMLWPSRMLLSPPLPADFWAWEGTHARMQTFSVYNHLNWECCRSSCNRALNGKESWPILINHGYLQVLLRAARKVAHSHIQVWCGKQPLER